MRSRVTRSRGDCASGDSADWRPEELATWAENEGGYAQSVLNISQKPFSRDLSAKASLLDFFVYKVGDCSKLIAAARDVSKNVTRDSFVRPEASSRDEISRCRVFLGLTTSISPLRKLAVATVAPDM